MLPPTRPQSTLRTLTTRTNRSIRLAALIALVALAGTAFAATNSSASSLGRMFFAKTASIIAGGPTAPNASSSDHALEAEAAPVEASSSTMTTERRGHTATRLADGRVLIAGGENSSGPLNQTEIYDPAAATFSPAGNMNEARVDHSATLLADGRVLLIGGRNSSGALSSTEIFEPATGAFTSGPSMSVARAGHSATLFANGSALVVGGNASGSAELLAADLSGFSPAGSLNTARSLHSAVLLQDGRVLVVGGRDASGNELTSGEVFDTPASAFSTVDGELQVARVRPHLRLLFDGKVQIIGGNNDGSMEIYDPLYEDFGAYAHVVPETDPCPGLPGQVLASQTRAALFHNGQTDALLDRSGHTITELSGGQALVVGGVNSSGVVLSSTSVLASSGAAITTDKMDYAPGEIAHVTGRGFQPGETVRLKIHEDPHTPQERGLDMVADADGNITGDYVVQVYDIDMKFLVGARGLTSGAVAQTTFTDANPQNITVAAPTSATVIQGATANYGNVTLTVGGNSNPCTVTFGVSPALPAGAAAVFGSNPNTTTGANVVTTLSVTTSASTPTGSYTFQVTGTNSGAGCQGPGPTPSGTLTLVVNSAAVNTTTTVANASATYGDTSVTLNATVTPASGPAINSGSVTFTVKQGATTIGVATTDNTVVAGAASVSYALPAGTNAGPYTIQAAYTPGAGFNASSGTGSLTINKRNTLTTVSSSVNPSTFGESVSFSATVVGTGAGAGNPSGGSVQFKIDGVNFGAAVALSGGSASSGSISTLSAGNHSVEAVFTSSDTNFNDSSDLLDGGQVVNKRNTLTTVSSTLNPSTFGESVSFSATVVGTGAGAGNPSGGSVQFKIDGVNFGAAVALSGGSASSGSISTLSAGNHSVEAVFTSSDTNFNDSNDLLDGGQVVNKRNTLTTVSSSLNPSTFGESVSFSATVVGTGAGAGNPSGGSVQFKIDGVNFGAAVALSGDSASSGSISTLSAGNHIVEAVFTSSDANFNDSNDLLDGGQVVNKRNTLTTVSSSLNPSTFGESVSFRATVVGTGPGAGNPSGGSVQFKIDGVNFGAAVALSGGTASSGSISTLSAGNHTVEAVFTSGDTNFNDSNDSLDGEQQVNKRNTLTTVSSSINPSTFGENVSFSATVVGTGAGAGNPSGGSVQFKIDGVNFGAAVALSGGAASSGFTSTLSSGNHIVEAVFTSSDTNFNDSNDLLDGEQQVNKRATLTTTSSSLNPSVYGQNVTFSATVVGTGPGAGNPSGGSVQFKIDGVNFGAAVALSGGSASSGSTSTLSAGNHTVEAVFTSSDTNFSNSNDLLDGGQNVNKASLTITASSHTITFNDPVPTITASYSGFVLGEGPSNLTTQPTCSTTYTVGSLIGTYPTKCENAVSSNYNISYVDGTVAVLTACSAFNGFLPPIGGAVESLTGGSFANPIRSFKLNSTVPVKFSAICFGAPLTTGIHTLQAIKYSNSTTSDPAIDATPTDSATSGNQFRLTDGEWHFNLNTKALGGNASGVWLLRATLFDGSTYTVWVSVKK
jgi:Bacterial Ig-like domain (group 3)/MBG domain (YGX type)/Galactose oxidase, central domain